MASKLAIFALATGLVAAQYQPLGYTSLFTETHWIGVTCAPPAYTTTTTIPFGAAALSGVTVHPASSPTSCYQLPTAVSALTPMALPLNQILDTPAHDDNPTQPIFFYVGENGTSPKYLGTSLGSDSFTLVDLSDTASSAGRLAMFLPGSARLVLDRAGIHFFPSGCEIVHSIAIDSFWGQIVNLTGSSPVSRHFSKREAQSESQFTIQVQVDKSSQNSSSNTISYGPSPCQLQGTTPSPNYDTLVFVCQYPGANSAEKTCESSFHSWLSNSPIDPTGVPGNLSDFLNLVSPFLTNQQSNTAISSLLPGNISHSLQWLGSTAQAVANQAVEQAGMSLCSLLHAADEYDLTFGNGSVATKTLGSFVTPPAETLVVDLRHVQTTSTTTRDPPRAQQPGSSLVSQTWQF